MNICVLQVKGGVGKTSISKGVALSQEFNIITNDLVSSYKNIKTIKCNVVDEKLKRIPTKYLRKDRNVLFDMGAMHGNIDPKVAHAAELADCFIIPTLSDILSIDGAIQTLKFIEGYSDNIFIIINKVKTQQEYDEAVSILAPYINTDYIYCIKETTLFRRVARDGDDWFHNINHQKGAHQLVKTIDKHNEIFEEIIDITSQLLALKE